MFCIDDNEFDTIADVIDYIERRYDYDVKDASWWEEGKKEFLATDDADEFVSWLDDCGYAVEYYG